LHCPNKYALSAAKIWLKTPPPVLRKFSKFIFEALGKNLENLEIVWPGFDLPKSTPKKALRSAQQFCIVCCKDTTENPTPGAHKISKLCKFISGVLVKNP